MPYGLRQVAVLRFLQPKIKGWAPNPNPRFLRDGPKLWVAGGFEPKIYSGWSGVSFWELGASGSWEPLAEGMGVGRVLGSRAWELGGSAG